MVIAKASDLLPWVVIALALRCQALFLARCALPIPKRFWMSSRTQAWKNAKEIGFGLYVVRDVLTPEQRVRRSNPAVTEEEGVPEAPQAEDLARDQDHTQALYDIVQAAVLGARRILQKAILFPDGSSCAASCDSRDNGS